MQTNSPASPASKFRRRLCVALVFWAIVGWYEWKAYKFGQTAKEAKALGWSFSYDEPHRRMIKSIFSAGDRKDTWNSLASALHISKDDQWEQHFDLIHRLDPENLEIYPTFGLRDLSKFTALLNLVSLSLYDCPNLTNIDALKDMKGLTRLRIGRAPGISNIDALKELKTLKDLDLSSCAALTNVDALRELKALKVLDLMGCAGLKNLDGILRLTGLEKLDLSDCDGLTNEAVAAVRVALPNTYIQNPGTSVFIRGGKTSTVGATSYTVGGETLTPDKK